MYNGSLESNCRKRRKTNVNLKPVSPKSFNTAALTKFLKNISCCFTKNVNLKPVSPKSFNTAALTKFLKNISCCFTKTKEVTNFKSTVSGKVTTLEENSSACLQTERPDLAPILREITTNFFEKNCQQHSKSTVNFAAHLGKNKSETSVCNRSYLVSKDSCRRKRSSKISKIDIVNDNSDLDLKAAKHCVSASAFLTTSFFSLSHKPQYSTYPIHINLHYAEDHAIDANIDKSSQYCEKDFLESNKNAETSTRGLQCFSDNSTQSEYVYDSADYLAHHITAKVAHFFEFTPATKTKIKQKPEKASNNSRKLNKGTNTSLPLIWEPEKASNNSRKLNKGTNTSLPLIWEQEPTLLYVNSTRYFVSTDDTTMERSSEDERSKSNFRDRKIFRRNIRSLNTKNCYTSMSETRLSPEMCPKFKKWYEYLQTNMMNHNATFCHFGCVPNLRNGTNICKQI
ncbi:hypothetical protein QE152_g7371 [Popillia japonica]|uniref:Uncharacterized protein n=1 Tax=Popillia japonica TaxID=7064 RepID=A0AAW1ME92_POPJA